MTPEERQLLLQDLCARLPYGVKVDVAGNTQSLVGLLDELVSAGYDINDFDDYALEDVKPYLRPMSSMTEEEEERKCAFLDDIEGGIEEAIPNYIDWLNKKMFDYRGLIPMGLALPATEGMYNIK